MNNNTKLKVIKTIKVIDGSQISKDIYSFLLQVYKRKEIVLYISENPYLSYEDRLFSAYFKREFGLVNKEKVLILL